VKLFATKVWGSALDGRVPIATFGSSGHVNRLLRLASHGDRLVMVGTKTEHTGQENRGRILSMCEFGFQPLRSLDYLKKEELDPRDFDEKGNFKFPFGVPMVRAWAFDEKPLLSDVIKQKLTMLSTPGAEEIITESDIRAILALQSREVTLPEIPQLASMRPSTIYSDQPQARRQPIRPMKLSGQHRRRVGLTRCASGRPTFGRSATQRRSKAAKMR
jgi:hypothetical protein